MIETEKVNMYNANGQVVPYDESTCPKETSPKDPECELLITIRGYTCSLCKKKNPEMVELCPYEPLEDDEV